MNLGELKSALSQHSDLNLRFELPNGELLPSHAHVTEVARIEKRFVDCGGTQRTQTICRLQAWVAKDFWHRLAAGKLLTILEKAAPLLGSDDLMIDIEYERGVITQSPVHSVTTLDGELLLRLGERHTECLAKQNRRFRWRNLFRSSGR